MVCAKFVVSDHVTDVGCRGFIISRILSSSDLKKGTAINIGKNKVEVRLCGEREDIENFYSQLKKELVEKYGNPVVRVGRIEYSSALYVPSIERAANAHLLEQFDKGIDVLHDLGLYYFAGMVVMGVSIAAMGILLAAAINIG